MVSTRGSKRHSTKAVSDDSDNEGPEEIQGQSAEAQRLRALHEQSSLPAEKKRKVSRKHTGAAIAAEALDASVLEVASAINFKAVAQQDRVEETAAADVDISQQGASKSRKMWVYLCVIFPSFMRCFVLSLEVALEWL
jgi:hypothetical protein